MIYVKSFLAALAVVVVMVFSNKHLLVFPISDFIVGWISCMAYFFTYKYLKPEEDYR